MVENKATKGLRAKFGWMLGSLLMLIYFENIHCKQEHKQLGYKLC